MSNTSDNYNFIKYSTDAAYLFGDINKSINHFLALGSPNVASKEYAKLKKYLDSILVDMQQKEQQLVNALEICEKYNNNLLDDSKDEDSSIFVKKSKNGNLFYNNTEEKHAYNQKYTINEIGYSMNMQSVDDIKDIPSMFYWYKDGIYCSPFPGIHIKVPFLEVVNTLRETPKDRTVKCSYKTKDTCSRHSKDKICTFAHKGDSYVKISPYARCPKNPTFGDKMSLVHDISYLKEDDMRVIAMYGISDIILTYIWYDMQKWKGAKVIDNIDKCI
jgi:hypothetical protein